MKTNSLVFTMTLLFAAVVWANPPSTQLIVVTGDNINSKTAKLQRYQRENSTQAWQAVGAVIPVTVGKNGMAWGNAEKKPKDIPAKKEGDLRTPIGLFDFGTTFGFAKGLDLDIKFPYFPLTKSTVCVDDSASPFYNQIIDSNKVKKSSWNSGEQMLDQVPNYKWGIVVNYNYPDPKPGAGSCIFVHVWKKPGQGTAGCVAMAETDMKQLLTWLDSMKNPQILIKPIAPRNDKINEMK
ncbi:hypothetical protein BH10PSE19_BH10PSE19_13630 [soil metagenome]